MSENPQRLNLWIIEDSIGYRSSLKKALLTFSEIESIEGFSSCTSALNALQKGASADLILMDLGLPKISGVRGIEKIKAMTTEIPIVVLTVFEEKEKVLSALKAGASGYLLKTASADEIFSGILQATQGGVPLNPQITRHLISGLTQSTNDSELLTLTDRERDVLRNMTRGLSMKENAEDLSLSKYTINFHMRNLYRKLGVRSQTEAVAKAVRFGQI